MDTSSERHGICDASSTGIFTSDSVSSEYYFCENCKRYILNSNKLTHEVMCIRRIQYCSICCLPIDKSILEKHISWHKPIKCSCGEEISRELYDKHIKNVCLNREVICEYCELNFKYTRMIEHTKVCGSRTELCERCGKRVQLINMKGHACVKCPICDGLFDNSDMLQLHMYGDHQNEM